MLYQLPRLNQSARFKISTVLLVAIACMLCLPTASFAQSTKLPTLKQKDKQIIIKTADGKHIATMGSFKFPWKPGTSFTLESFKTTAEPNTYHATYITHDAKKNPIKPLTLTADFVITNAKQVGVTFKLTSDEINLDDKKKWFSGAMAELRLPKNSSPRQLAHLGLWTRHEFGGVPFEVTEGSLYYYDTKDMRLGIQIPKSNAKWFDTKFQNVGAVRVDEHHYEFKINFLLAKPGTPVEAIAAMLNNRPLSVSIETNKVYNWFPTSDEPAKATIIINNASDVSQSFETEISARDFDGKIIYDYSKRLSLAPFASRTIQVELPAKERNFYFLEASIHENHLEVFDRTNIVVLQPFEFKQDPKTSIFGLAAFWSLPTQQDMFKLMHRMGVRWARQLHFKDPAEIPSWLNVNHHASMRAKVNPTDSEKQKIEQRFREMLAKAEKFNCHHLEFANEWNMSHGINKAYLAPTYVENYLTVLDNLRKETNSPVKLTMVGLAGMDHGFVKKMYEHGAWDKFDILNLHPGRGNFTADYDPNDPGTVGTHGNYWNFYGALRGMKRLSKKYGEKPIILSETYACTYPNSFWEDTIRNAAENTYLTHALSLAEGVQRVYWYQLNNGTWWRKGGVKHTDREFYFGLLNRDLSFKPSLMSYINAAETLDQATYIKHLTFKSDAKAKGLLFAKPNGNVTILWHRADGYQLTEKKKPFPSPEPWVNTWKTKTPMIFKTTGNTVTTKDVLGRTKTYQTKNHKVELILDGAPLFVTGLKLK